MAGLNLQNYLLMDTLSHHGGGHGYYYGGHHRGGMHGMLPMLALTGGLGGTTGGVLGGQGLTDYLLLDSMTHHGSRHYYGGHHRGGMHGMLPMIALTGGLGGTTGGVLGGQGLTDYLLLDSMTHHGGHRGYYGHHGGLGSSLLPAMALTGGLGGVGSSNVGQLMALNSLGGSHHGSSDILPLALLGGEQATQMWGLQQMQHGSHNPIALMSATGQALPTDVTSLALLGSMGHHGGHRGYYGHGGYAHHAPARHYGHHSGHRVAHAGHHGRVAHAGVHRPVHHAGAHAGHHAAVRAAPVVVAAEDDEVDP